MFQALRKPVLILAGLLGFYALSGFLIFPIIVQTQLPELIEEETGRNVFIGKVEFNPFSLEFSLTEFSIQEAAADQNFMAFKVLAGNIGGFDSIRKGALVVDDIRLEQPFASVVKNKTGAFNFSDLMRPAAAEQKAPDGIFPFLIRELSIVEGTLVWEDAHFTKPERETITPIEVSISGLTTLDSKPANGHLASTFSSGGRFDWRGNFVIQPLRTKGAIDLERLSLSRLWTLFLQETIPLKIKEAIASVSAEYEFNGHATGYNVVLSNAALSLDKLKLAAGKDSPFQNAVAQKLNIAVDCRLDDDGKMLKIALNRVQFTGTQMRVTGAQNTPDMALQAVNLKAESAFEVSDQRFAFVVKKGAIDLQHFELFEHDQPDALLEIPAIVLAGINVDSAQQAIDIASLKTQNARIKTWLTGDGTINYQTLFASSPSDTKVSSVEVSADQSVPETPWKLHLGKILADNYQVNFSDQSRKQAVAFDLMGLKIELDDFSNEAGAKLPFTLNAQINGDGGLNVSGEAVLSPFAADLSVDINDIALRTAQPYLDDSMRLDIIDGDLSTQGKLLIALADSEALDLKYQGDVDIVHLLVRDKIQNKDFVKWNSLKLGKLSFDLQQRALHLDEAIFDQPYARLIVKKDSTTNIGDVVLDQAPEPEQKAADTPIPFTFNIGTIRVAQGVSDFADYSLILPFITQMNNLDGTLTGLSTEPGATAKLLLKGKVYDLANVDINGRYQIDSGDSEVNLNFKNMPLPLVTPYMAEFAGYKIEKGQMSLDLSYSIHDSKLEASNNLFIDQFTLGEKVENPNAVSLPLNLAIALLKDSEGKINLDLPISGSLDDPEFSVGSLVFKALANLIGKVIASPFQAIAALIGGDEDLSVVTFNAGSAELNATEKSKLDALAKALQQRPALRLDIKGIAYQNDDWPAMRFDALTDQLKKLRAKELKTKGIKTRSEYIELVEEDYRRLLAQLFIEKFPLLAEYSLLGKPQLKQPEAGDFYDIARQKLEAIIVPEQQRLNNLAMLRAGNIAKYLIRQGEIADDRIFILAAELDPESDESGIIATLTLTAAP